MQSIPRSSIVVKPWPWCIDSGAPINDGHVAMRPEPVVSGLYRCYSCGREVAACHPGGGGELRLARHKRRDYQGR